MTETIGNPLSWGAKEIGTVGRHLGTVVGKIGHGDVTEGELPAVRQITVHDLREVLRKGIEDFGACRTDVVFLCVFYPVVGMLLAWMALDRNLLPLLFPVTSGFALIGPVAAVGLYEMSRQREMGEEPDWAHAFARVKSPSFGAILVLGLMLGGVFVVWLLAAHGIYYATLGPEPPTSIGGFAREIFTTGAGWAMIFVGCGVGFLFAALVLATSVVSFPLLLDRDVGLPVGGDHLDARRRRQPGADRGLGADRRRRAGARVDPALPRADRGHAGPRPRDLAPLPPDRGPRSGSRGQAGGRLGRVLVKAYGRCLLSARRPFTTRPVAPERKRMDVRRRLHGFPAVAGGAGYARVTGRGAQRLE